MKSNVLTLKPCEIYVFGWDMFMMSIVIGTKWSFLLMYMYSNVDVGASSSWVELPVQRRLCPIFVNSVGSPDIHDYSAG